MILAHKVCRFIYISFWLNYDWTLCCLLFDLILANVKDLRAPKTILKLKKKYSFLVHFEMILF